MRLSRAELQEIEGDPDVVAAARALGAARKRWAGEKAALEYRADRDLERLADELETAREAAAARRVSPRSRWRSAPRRT